MRILFFDTETNGLPKNYKADPSNDDNYPLIVELGMIVTDEFGEELYEYSFLRKEVTIPESVSNIHGITEEIANKKGLPLEQILLFFVEAIMDCDRIVAHNFDFDYKVAMSEFLRNGFFEHIGDLIKIKKPICTMKSTTKFVGIKNKFGFKWPTLQELHKKLFNEEFTNVHNALTDVTATKKCFFELIKRGILPELTC